MLHVVLSVAKLKTVHIDKVVELQREIDNLKQMLDTETYRAQDLESTDHTLDAENTTANRTIEGLRQKTCTQITRARRTEWQRTSSLTFYRYNAFTSSNRSIYPTLPRTCYPQTTDTSSGGEPQLYLPLC